MPHEIQNFGNSVAHISIPGQFHTYLEFRGEKYLKTFIVTNVNDCPHLCSYGATLRMGVLLPNYPEENVVKGDNIPNFRKVNGSKTGNSTSHDTQNGISYVNTGNSTASSTPDGMSNMFQILNNTQKRQRAIGCQYDSSRVPTAPEMETPFRTTTPSAPTMTAVTGRFSTCTCTPSAKYFMEWTSSTLCTCPQATEMGSQTRRLLSLKKSPTLHNGGFCEQTPIDEARHSVTLFQLL